jgi:hypothetical protein
MTIIEARRHMERRELSVVYRTGHGEPEYGEITNVNDHYVFVRFEGSEASRATDPADLTPLAGSGAGT